jgi:peptidoglycan/xylan/chitin deacetylase (PgdA/CDA1 family)
VALESWPGGQRVAVVFTIAYESWADGRVPALGPMGNPLPPGVPDLQARSWGRYGRREGIHRLARILGNHDVKATVMASGVLAEQAPETLRMLADAGHDLCAHSYSQDVLPGALTAEEERDEVERCVRLLTEASGQRPRGWMSPRGTPSERTGQLLVDAGLDWHGDCFDADLAYLEQHDGGSLVAIPFAMEVNDLPVCLKNGNPPRTLLDVYRDTVAWSTANEPGLTQIDVTVHAHYFGRPAGAWVYDAIIAEAKANPEVWIGTRSEIADLVRAAN